MNITKKGGECGVDLKHLKHRTQRGGEKREKNLPQKRIEKRRKKKLKNSADSTFSVFKINVHSICHKMIPQKKHMLF